MTPLNTHILNPSDFPLTLLYDGNCPVCCIEMHALRDLAIAQNPHEPALRLINIAAPGFDPAPYGTSLAAMNHLIHAQKPDGSLVIGLDALLLSYSAVDSSRWLKLTRLPLLKPISHAGYALFARHRYKFSRYLAPIYARLIEPRIRKAAQRALAASQACHNGACEISHPNSSKE